MAERPVFVPCEKAPFYGFVTVSFDWNGGFAKSQKQKNIKAIHDAFTRINPGKQVLEISSKSMQEHGEDLSAFFLKKYVPSIDQSIPVECVFQAAKTFSNGGPYKDLQLVAPRDAKRDERLKTGGRLVGFTFEGTVYPLEPKTAFYDYIYLNALLENEALAHTVLQYDAFTDIEFNPDKSLNCQAKAAAAFVSLTRMGLIDQVKDFESFLKLNGAAMSTTDAPEEKKNVITHPVAKSNPVQMPQIKCGDIVIHNQFGNGSIISVTDTTLTVEFPEEGRKKLGKQWCIQNCIIEPQQRKSV